MKRATMTARKVGTREEWLAERLAGSTARRGPQRDRRRVAPPRRVRRRARPGVDAGLVLDTLVGLLAWRTFVTREATGEEVLERAVDLIVSGVGAARAG